MSDKAVDKFRININASIWEYRRDKNYEGFHFHCAKDDVIKFKELLDLMLEAEYSSKKIIKLSKIMKGHEISSCKRNPQFFEFLEIRSKREPNEEYWKMFAADKTVIFEITPEYIKGFKNDLEDYRQGGFDYAIGEEDQSCLWLW